MRHDLIRRVARLARIEVDAEQVSLLAEELGRISRWVETLPVTPLSADADPAEPGRGGDSIATGPAPRTEPPDRSSPDLLDGAPVLEDHWVVVPAVRLESPDPE